MCLLLCKHVTCKLPLLLLLLLLFAGALSTGIKRNWPVKQSHPCVPVYLVSCQVIQLTRRLSLQAGSTEAEQLETGIPELTTKAQQLEQQLQAQEQVLQQLQEGVREEVEQHTQALQEVRRQLAPWDQQISQVQSRLAVATAEQDMLQKSHSEAKQRFQVCFIT